MNRLVIIGSGIFGKQVMEIALLQNKYEIVGFYDDFEKENTVYGLPLLGTISNVSDDYLDGNFDYIFYGIGYNNLNFKFNLSLKLNIPKATIIHPSALIEKSATIGDGVLLYANAYIGPNVILKDNVTVNINSYLPHDNVVDECTFISGTISVGGKTNIGKCCFIGLASTIIDNITIADNVILGAGTLVVKTIDKEGTYIGSPSKKIP